MTQNGLQYSATSLIHSNPNQNPPKSLALHSLFCPNISFWCSFFWAPKVPYLYLFIVFFAPSKIPWSNHPSEVEILRGTWPPPRESSDPPGPRRRGAGAAPRGLHPDLGVQGSGWFDEGKGSKQYALKKKGLVWNDGFHCLVVCSCWCFLMRRDDSGS